MSVPTAPGRQVLRPDAEAELLRRYHQDIDLDARGQLVESLMGLVHHIARRYVNRGVAYEELVQVGAVGLIKAVDRFEIDRGVKLSTFAAPNIAGEIKRHFRDRTWALRVPRDIQELDAAINRAVEKLTTRLHRSPTIPEIAEAVDATEEQVLETLRGALNHSTVSFEEPISEGRTALDVLGEEDADYRIAEHRVLIQGGLDTLDARDREIVRLRFYDELSQREIGERIGISQMHVSRLLVRALARMREAVDVS